MTGTRHRHLGDELPVALDRYYRSLDAGDFDAAAAAFTTDALYAVPPAEGGETDARSISDGRDAIAERFRARGPRPSEHVVTLCTATTRDVLVEGFVRDRATDAATLSFAASAQLAPDGLISRYVAYSSTPIDMSAADANPSDGTPGSAIDRIHEYFHALDESRFDAAAACFSVDTLYSHPPYRDPDVGGTGRADFVGRPELEAAFGRRGPQQIDHRIVIDLQRGPHLLLEGVVNGPAGTLLGTFVSSATLDDDGLIKRYVAYYCQPGIPRR